MKDEVVIKVNNVSKSFILPHARKNSVKSIFTELFSGVGSTTETQNALKNLSFEVIKGEFLGIVGRNGGGKSTLLKILAGVYQPTEGKVTTIGKIVPFIELGVGFNPELSGRDNIYLNGAMLGFSNNEIDHMYDEIVRFAEMERFMDQKLKNYSSGMQVRLAFSMAIRSKAEILLIDEVLAVGDADFQRKCYDYFRSLKNKDITVIFVSHDMSAVIEYCDRAILIEKSEISKIGSPVEVAEEYLKLFTISKPSIHSEYNKNSGRWGDRKVKITNADIDTSKKIHLNVTVQAHSDFKGLIVGFRIKDATGADILGINTKNINYNIPDLKNGEKKVVSFVFEHILKDGEYLVDLALQHHDEITVADWWNEALKFTVMKGKNSPYVVEPDFEVETSD